MTLRYLSEPKVPEDEEKVYVKVLLRGDVLKRFRYIKDRLGLETDTEVIRLSDNARVSKVIK